VCAVAKHFDSDTIPPIELNGIEISTRREYLPVHRLSNVHGNVLVAGKKNEVMKKMHLFFELRPTVSVLSIPETKTYVYPSMQNCVGIKFEW
jgi:hypothetical protein